MATLLVRHIRIILEVLKLGPRNWIHLDRSQQASLFCMVIKLVVKPVHVVSALSLFFPFCKGLDYCLMLCEFRPTGACPSTGETAALGTIIAGALVGDAVMFLKRVFAEALEVIGAVGWDIIEAFTLAFGCVAWRLLASWSHVVMILELVVAETLCFGTDHLAILSLFVAPRQIEPVFRFL